MAVRSGLQRFVRILLTSGSGESIWLLAVFLFGALALGITSNFLFGLALSPATVSLPGFGRVGCPRACVGWSGFCGLAAGSSAGAIPFHNSYEHN